MNITNVVTTETILTHLRNLRAMLIARMKSPACAPAMYNECREQLKGIDAQLDWHKDATPREPLPERFWTRTQRRDLNRKYGEKTFSERTLNKALFPAVDENYDDRG